MCGGADAGVGFSLRRRDGHPHDALQLALVEERHPKVAVGVAGAEEDAVRVRSPPARPPMPEEVDDPVDEEKLVVFVGVEPQVLLDVALVDRCP